MLEMRKVVNIIVQLKTSILLLVFCLSLVLSGCSNSSDNVSNNGSFTSETTEQIASEIETSSISDSLQKIDLSIPDEFVDYYKFIGMDVSVLNVDTSNWDFGDFSHDLWEGTFYGHNGKISVRLGWDKKTIVEFFLTLNDKEKIKDNERKGINEKVTSIYGNNIIERNISYEFSGNSDYTFSVPKTLEQESVCCVSWNDDILYEYFKSKPQEPDSEVETTEPKAKLEPAIGMSAEEVENSTWGKPTKKNKTTTAYGIHEQWVYSSGRYIYLDDGIVTAIQE